MFAGSRLLLPVYYELRYSYISLFSEENELYFYLQSYINSTYILLSIRKPHEECMRKKKHGY